MSLAKLIHRNKTDKAANTTDTTITTQKSESSADANAITTTHRQKNSPTLAPVASACAAKPTHEKINHDIQKIRIWLFRIGEPEEDHYLVINKCRNDPEALAYYLERIEESKREERLIKALAFLADNPKTQRAIIVDKNADPDNVILTIAIRDQYSFEMTIPKAKYDPFTILEIIKKAAVQ